MHSKKNSDPKQQTQPSLTIQGEDNNKHISDVKSEEVQAIIDRMPTHWVKLVILCVGILMGIIVILGFLIQYPDTVDGNISITSTNAPVHLVANSNGRIYLLVSNKSRLKKGDVISYVESGANYKHILLVDSLLHTLNFNYNNRYPLPDTLLLGEVSSAYNTFCLSYMQYQRLLVSDIYKTMRQNLTQQIKSDEAIVSNLNNELTLKKEILRTSKDQLAKDSVLMSLKGISEQEYQQHYASHLSEIESHLNINSNRWTKQSEVSHNKIEMQRILLEETENKEKAYSEFISHRNELANAINLWKEHYLQYSPIDGELEYLGFWKNNNFVQSGQELFSIMPIKRKIFGEVRIPSFGAGKVKAGQLVNVKINNYPYDEYGQIKGMVASVSRMTNQLKTEKGSEDTYLVLVSFPHNAVTNFGRVLPVDFETKGTVEIITKRKRLIERLFDNLKSKGEK